jgi:hypothetical protein
MGIVETIVVLLIIWVFYDKAKEWLGIDSD